MKTVTDKNGVELLVGQSVYVRQKEGIRMAKVIGVFPDRTTNVPGWWVDIDFGEGVQMEMSYNLEVEAELPIDAIKKGVRMNGRTEVEQLKKDNMLLEEYSRSMSRKMHLMDVTITAFLRAINKRGEMMYDMVELLKACCQELQSIHDRYGEKDTECEMIEKVKFCYEKLESMFKGLRNEKITDLMESTPYTL